MDRYDIGIGGLAEKLEENNDTWKRKEIFQKSPIPIFNTRETGSISRGRVDASD